MVDLENSAVLTRVFSFSCVIPASSTSHLPGCATNGPCCLPLVHAWNKLVLHTRGREGGGKMICEHIIGK